MNEPIQLEFPEFRHVVGDIRQPKKRRVVKTLFFVLEVIKRKFRIHLSDVDVIVLLVLAKAGEAMTFIKIVEATPVSNTGVWNSLERLETYEMIECKGPMGKHTYCLTELGIKKLHHLFKK